MYMTRFKALKIGSATPFNSLWALGIRYGGLNVVHLIFFTNFHCERILQGPKRDNLNEGFLCEAEGQEKGKFALLSFPDPSSPDWKGPSSQK